MYSFIMEIVIEIIFGVWAALAGVVIAFYFINLLVGTALHLWWMKNKEVKG